MYNTVIKNANAVYQIMLPFLGYALHPLAVTLICKLYFYALISHLKCLYLFSVLLYDQPLDFMLVNYTVLVIQYIIYGK